MFQMVENAKKQNDIEVSQFTRGQIVDTLDEVLNLRAKLCMCIPESRIVPAINRNHLSATALTLESKPPVPCADIKHPFAPKVPPYREPGEVGLQISHATNP
jgi:hypothetical protein